MADNQVAFLTEQMHVAQLRFKFLHKLLSLIPAWAESMHRHKKRGSVYARFGEARIQTEEPLKDNDVVQVYMDQHGNLYARREHEFFDGRFERVC